MNPQTKAVYDIEDLRRWNETTAGLEPPVRLGVFGDPVAHSRSPQMMGAALVALGISARYVRLHVGPADFPEALRMLPSLGFIGVNITIPHKQAALGLVDSADDHARAMGAVNTVLVDGGALRGSSTDGPGLVRAIREEFRLDLRDLRVLVLGAGGGAGRSISVQCAMEHCARLVLVNRSRDKAEALASDLAPYFRSERLEGPVDRLRVVPWDFAALHRELADIDLIIHTTPLGMNRGDPSPLPESALSPFHVVYDTVYAVEQTPLLAAAAAVGARGANGLSMLLHQGALSFERWFGRSAPLDAMRAGLRSTSSERPPGV